MAVVVVEHDPEFLVVHVPDGAPMGFVDGHPLGVHPWSVNGVWRGMDVLMAQRTGDAHSAWFFGPFATYINLQDPMRFTSRGFDTFDHELDIVVAPDGNWVYKDEDHLEASIESGRFTVSEGEAIRAEGQRVGRMLDAREPWWNPAWSQWSAPEGWPTPALVDDWASL